MELEKEYALTGVTLIDGNGGIPVKNTVVVVKTGVIDQVGDRRSVKINDDIQMVDTSGYYLMPGLVDCNVHLFLLGLPGTGPRLGRCRRGQPTIASKNSTAEASLVWRSLITGSHTG